jgi:hypothetical protein
MKAIINDTYVLRTPPQLFTTNVLNQHDYEHVPIIGYNFIEKPDGGIETETIYGEPIRIETYTIDEAYGQNSYWKIFTGPPVGVSTEAWSTAYAKIKDSTAKSLINLSTNDYQLFSEAQ